MSPAVYVHAGMLRTTMFSGRVGGVPVQLIRPADWNTCPLFRWGEACSQPEGHGVSCKV